MYTIHVYPDAFMPYSLAASREEGPSNQKLIIHCSILQGKFIIIDKLTYCSSLKYVAAYAGEDRKAYQQKKTVLGAFP